MLYVIKKIVGVVQQRFDVARKRVGRYRTPVRRIGIKLVESVE
jgi:hypothetical protein